MVGVKEVLTIPLASVDKPEIVEVDGVGSVMVNQTLVYTFAGEIMPIIMPVSPAPSGLGITMQVA